MFGLLGLELAYLIAANAFLSFGGVAKLFESTNQVNARFRRAWSLWPGHVHLRDLRITFQDHNLQWSLDMERGVIVIRLRELVSRTLHATSVRGDGLVFRFRHRIDPRSAHDAFVAALPPIPEFLAPAVFEATVPPPPIPDDKYNLWTVHLENVDVQVREAWMQQFRYRGPARASGAFRLRPARELWVGPASLELGGGRVTLADATLARRLEGRVSCRVHPFDVRVPVGRQVFRFLSTDLDWKLTGLELTALRLLFPEHPELTFAAAPGSLKLKLKVDHGRLRESSRSELSLPEVRVDAPRGRTNVRDARLTLSVLRSDQSEARLEVAQGEVRGGEDPVALEFERLTVVANGDSTDTTGEWHLTQTRAELKRLVAPDLSRLNAFLPDAGFAWTHGSAEAALQARYAGELLSGEAKVEANAAQARWNRGAAEFDGQTQLEFSNLDWSRRSGAVTARILAPHAALLSGRTRVSLLEIEAAGHGQFEQAAGSSELELRARRIQASGQSFSLSSGMRLSGHFERSRRATQSLRVRGEFSGVRGATQNQKFSFSAPTGIITASAALTGRSAAGGRVEASFPKLRANTPDLHFASSLVVAAQMARSGGGRGKSRVTVEAALRELSVRDVDADQSLLGSAERLRLKSELSAGAEGYNGWIIAEPTPVSIKVGTVWAHGKPDGSLQFVNFDRERRQGSVEGKLRVSEFSLDDSAQGRTCPWSQAERATLQGRWQLSSEQGDRLQAEAELVKGALHWGEFTASADARIQLRGEHLDPKTGDGEYDFRLEGKDAHLDATVGSKGGWEAHVPHLLINSHLRAGASHGQGKLAISAGLARGRIGAIPIHTKLRADLNLQALDLERRDAVFSGTVRLSQAGLDAGTTKVDDWWAQIALDSTRVETQNNFDLIGSFRAKVRDALPAMAVLSDSGQLPAWVSGAFPLRGLELTGIVARRCRLTDIRLTRAEGGPLALRGRLQSFPEWTRGAALLQLAGFQALALGIRFDPADTDLKLFASDGWFSHVQRELDVGTKEVLQQACPITPSTCGK